MTSSISGEITSGLKVWAASCFVVHRYHCIIVKFENYSNLEFSFYVVCCCPGPVLALFGLAVPGLRVISLFLSLETVLAWNPHSAPFLRAPFWQCAWSTLVTWIASRILRVPFWQCARSTLVTWVTVWGRMASPTFALQCQCQSTTTPLF